MRDARDYEWRRPHSSSSSSSSSRREECPYNACGNRVCRQRLRRSTDGRHFISASRGMPRSYVQPIALEPKYII
uniref:Post-SET domain-containing protein n=1 Tax=Trichogramma kaykai TaxID=54128 RepID=A0ABD2X4Y5_9HYME